jgi:hypothetical protein
VELASLRASTLVPGFPRLFGHDLDTLCGRVLPTRWRCAMCSRPREPRRRTYRSSRAGILVRADTLGPSPSALALTTAASVR